MEKIEIGSSNFTQCFVLDEKGQGNANHRYSVSTVHEPSVVVATVDFQNGPILEHGVNGCHNEDLLAIVLHRLEGFQSGDYKCRENALAITKIEEALHWLNHRTSKRKQRGVEGTHVI